MERWQQIEEIFHEALQQNADSREAYVRDACCGDTSLFREVSSLLANQIDPGDGGFRSWAASAAARLVDVEVSLKPGECLGPYRIDSFLAAGGMGVVYRATDTRLNREVAIKISATHFSKRLVGRDESCDKVACARPPSQNPPSRFPATGSPGCSR